MPELYFCHDCETVDNFYQEHYTPEPEEFVSGALHPDDEGVETKCGQCHSNDVSLEVLCETCQNALPFDTHIDCAHCIAHGKHPHTRNYEACEVQEAKIEVFDDLVRDLALEKQISAGHENSLKISEEMIALLQKQVTDLKALCDLEDAA